MKREEEAYWYINHMKFFRKKRWTQHVHTEYHDREPDFIERYSKRMHALLKRKIHKMISKKVDYDMLDAIGYIPMRNIK